MTSYTKVIAKELHIHVGYIGRIAYKGALFIVITLHDNDYASEHKSITVTAKSVINGRNQLCPNLLFTCMNTKKC